MLQRDAVARTGQRRYIRGYRYSRYSTRSFRWSWRRSDRHSARCADSAAPGTGSVWAYALLALAHGGAALPMLCAPGQARARSPSAPGPACGKGLRCRHVCGCRHAWRACTPAFTGARVSHQPLGGKYRPLKHCLSTCQAEAEAGAVPISHVPASSSRLLCKWLGGLQVAGALFAAGATPHGAPLVQLLAAAPAVSAFTATALMVRMRSLRPAPCSGDLSSFLDSSCGSPSVPPKGLTRAAAAPLQRGTCSSTASLQRLCRLQLHGA
jgi:hypothetical protein